MGATVVWLEIGASDLYRAVKFYENVFSLKLDIQLMYDRPMAFFTKEDLGIKGSIIQFENYTGNGGIKPIFYVNILHTTIEKVQRFGGQVISPPSIMRQKNKNGDTIIGSNLIDGQVGYYAEIKDSEGNSFYLYSHS